MDHKCDFNEGDVYLDVDRNKEKTRIVSIQGYLSFQSLLEHAVDDPQWCYTVLRWRIQERRLEVLLAMPAPPTRFSVIILCFCALVRISVKHSHNVLSVGEKVIYTHTQTYTYTPHICLRCILWRDTTWCNTSTMAFKVRYGFKSQNSYQPFSNVCDHGNLLNLWTSDFSPFAL